MPRRSTPTLNGQALAQLRSLKHVTQAELAARAGLRTTAVSAFENGRRPLPREELDRLAGLMGCGPEEVEGALLEVEARALAAGAGWVAPSPAVRRTIDCMALRAARTTLGTVRTHATRETVATWARQERTAAAELWERLRPLGARERRARVAADPVYHSWGLAELLCAASEKAAPADAGTALALADLALHTAGTVHESAAWRRRIQGYCWAYVGNARRVAGKLVLADDAFAQSEEHWEAGQEADPGGILDEGRLLDMRASLRCAQRRFEEALALHQSALALTPPAKRGYILLNMSKLWEEQHRYEEAIDVLQQALEVINRGAEPRLHWGTRFNLIVNLCHLRRYAEAKEALPEVRDIALQIGNPLDLVRLLWLNGWVAAGLGEIQDAIVALNRARREFAERLIDYDMALVSLDLAVLHLQQGSLDKVKEIAREMKPIFYRERVHREALAALKLFCEAALEERATVEQVRRLYEYLNLARHDPRRKFEG